MGTLKKYLPFVVVAVVVLYFYPQIMGALPTSIRRLFIKAA